MASPVPAKSQPLHNFSLPHLKWRNHRSGRSRLAGESSSSSPPHRSPSTPWRESSSPTSHVHIHAHLHQSSPYVSRRPSPLHNQSRSESESEQNGAVLTRKPSRKQISEKSTKVIKPIDNSKGKRSNNKICIRIRKNGVGDVKHEAAVIEENHSSTPEQQNAAVPSSAAEEEESSPKIWNLRPRRPPISHKQSNIGSPPLPENRCNPTKETSEAKHNDYSNPMTSKKHNKFSISLSREEIEEDIFSLTGAKPSRRPKKRPRIVRKQLDTLFPGLWLGSITADTYKVSEAHSKV